MIVRRRLGSALLCCLAAAACGAEHEPWAPAPLVYDFGEIPHGETASHEFVVPVPPGDGWVPIGYSRNCTCALHRFVVHAEDGSVRHPTGQPHAEFALRDGDELRLQIEIDTAANEPASRAPTTIPGEITLQRAVPPYEQSRVPVRFSYGIHAPIEILPAATVDLGGVPRAVRFGRTYTLRGVERPVAYGATRCVERDPVAPEHLRRPADIEASLRDRGDGAAELRVEFEPGAERPLGPFAAHVEIETDLPGGYLLRIPVSGFVVPDVELAPPGKLTFGQIDLDRASTQQLVITDHDPSRAPDFYVTRIVDHTGQDASSHFSARFEPVPESPRSRVLLLDYDGSLGGRKFIRGEIHLAKAAGGETVQTVEYVAFQRR